MTTQTLIQTPEDIQLNNQDEIDQILGNPPSWLLRWGISLIFVAVLIFGAMAWLIKYPDIIAAEVQLLTENPAIRIIPIASGKLEKLLVANQQAVEKGDLLAVLESSVVKGDIEQLEQFLLHLEQLERSREYLKLEPPIGLSLGTMQNSYASLSQQLKDYQFYLKHTSLYSKIATLKDQIDHTKAINATLKKQQSTLKKEVAIAHNNYERNQKLNKEGVISDLDLEQIETNYLQYQRQSDNFSTQIISNKVQIEQIQAQIIDLKQSRTEGKNTRTLAIKETVQNLKSQIAIWKKSFLITAPIAGKINLADIWSENQFVTTGQELLTIVPETGAGKIIARAKLPLENAGKVKPGQIVNISLNGYPYQEFGILKSEVASMALVPQEEFYWIALKMPETLITTYDKVIPFAQEMKGNADIITEDRRILERVFDRLWSLLKNT